MTNQFNTPWEAVNEPWSDHYVDILGTDGNEIADSVLTQYAAHIVKCVNAHDALVDALKDMFFAHTMKPSCQDGVVDRCKCVDCANERSFQALKLATGYTAATGETK